MKYLSSSLKNAPKNLRQESVTALAKWLEAGEPQALKPLEKITKNTKEDVNTRLISVKALVKIGNERAMKPLIKIVGNPKEDGKLSPDNFRDDLALAIKTGLGLVIILGCAHRGMINTINHFQEITGDDRVYSIIGGTHLISASSERLIQTVADLKKIGIQKLGVSHCTGFGAAAWLAGEFPEIFFCMISSSSLNGLEPIGSK